ncbi:hypothetical protein K933_10647 [Candidatus Halobonum tyrrellensis G22]|uniref:DUF192 domain-containing protein n=1 Tax=Candidatus Halobonum tyrrellensis G22 TaxID=1324957 RepID=V4HDJ1_9EURY|nr:hypothetical protein K933_10647 [Candidatus Halobonum tyrrellensis G22]
MLADRAEVAESFLAQARGLMFRRSIPEGYGLVFPFGEAASRSLHMVCVPFAIDAVWLVDGEVCGVDRLRPWVGLARARADTVVELPAGAADGVEEGDRVERRESAGRADADEGHDQPSRRVSGASPEPAE